MRVICKALKLVAEHLQECKLKRISVKTTELLG